MHDDLRSGRKLAAADLQLLILLLLARQPSHGYELIRAIEAHSNGFYVPSSGVVYPSLTSLEEDGLVAAELEGRRKRYELSASGRAYLEIHRAEADALMAQLATVGERMDLARRAFDRADPADEAMPGSELERARRDIKAAFATLRASDADTQSRAASILQRALHELRELLG